MTTNAVISADFPAGLALAQTLGLTTNTNTERPGRAVHVIARADQATLRLGLQPPHQGVIEGLPPGIRADSVSCCISSAADWGWR